MTPEETEQKRAESIEQKRVELQTQLGFEVHAFEFKDPKTNEVFTGYLQEPDRLTKMQCIDMASGSWTFAAKQLLDLTVIQKESHPFIWEDFNGRSSQRDAVYFGALQFAQTLIKRFNDVLKKK